jgi:hypothetical protein
MMLKKWGQEHAVADMRGDLEKAQARLAEPLTQLFWIPNSEYSHAFTMNGRNPN